MEDTDWRPSTCPNCGSYRVAQRHPVCQNKSCSLYKGRSSVLKQEQKYVWFKDGAFEAIITDLAALYKHPDFNSTEDKIYELGPEVKLEMTIKVIPAKPVTRSKEN